MNPVHLAIVLEALGVVLVVLAITKDDLEQRYPWLLGKKPSRK